VALDRFGEAVIREGEPLAMMEEALVPLYLHHRYQAEATSKVVGGQYYTYALRGDGQDPLRPVSAAEQEAALDALMRTLDPEELEIPRQVLERLPPRPYGFPPHQELFSRWTGLVFDAVSPAAAAADATLGMLLHEERAARLVEQNALDPSLPSLEDVLKRVNEATFGREGGDAYAEEILRVTERAYVEHLMRLAAGAGMPQVRAVATRTLADLGVDLSERAAAASAPGRAHYFLVADMPPGSPIGMPGGVMPLLNCSWW